jgi:hypothetical protein
VRIVVGFAPATGADILARLMGQWLSDRLGQQFVIENRPGAGTNIATEAVVHSAPDGYTLLAVSPANAINALYEKLNFNFIQDIAPVASVNEIRPLQFSNPTTRVKPGQYPPAFQAPMLEGHQPGTSSICEGRRARSRAAWRLGIGAPRDARSLSWRTRTSSAIALFVGSLLFTRLQGNDPKRSLLVQQERRHANSKGTLVPG